MHMQEIKTTPQNVLQSLTIYTLILSQLHEVQLVLKVDLMVQIYFKQGKAHSDKDCTNRIYFLLHDRLICQESIHSKIYHISYLLKPST